jgi:hypothetical protein
VERKRQKTQCLGVKNGKVLVSDNFDAVRASAPGEVFNLGGVQVVRGGEEGDAALKIFCGGKRVGRVQAEIADEFPAGFGAKGFQNSAGADEDGAVQADEEVDDADLARLEDTRAGDAHRDAAARDPLDRGAKAVEIQIVQSDAGGRKFERGVELLRSTNQNMKEGFG